MSHVITHVQPGSVADKAGINAGDTLIQINGEDVIDQIDYQALSCHRSLRLALSRPDVSAYTARVFKGEYDPLGLQLEETLVSKPRCTACSIAGMSLLSL